MNLKQWLIQCVRITSKFNISVLKISSLSPIIFSFFFLCLHSSVMIYCLGIYPNLKFLSSQSRVPLCYVPRLGSSLSVVHNIAYFILFSLISHHTVECLLVRVASHITPKYSKCLDVSAYAVHLKCVCLLI